MNQRFDQEIRDEIQRDPVEVPEEVQSRMDELLESLPEKQNIRPVRRMPRTVTRILVTAACLFLVFLVALPNISVSYANALEKVPVLGSIVRVVTIRNYLYDEGMRTLDATVPSVEDAKHPDASKQINADIDELTDSVIDKFYDELELFGNGSRGSMYMNYEVLTNTEDWFTLKINTVEVAGSGNEKCFCYHIDRKTGEYVTFGDLFDEEGRAALEKIVKPQLVPPYWTEKEAGREHFWALAEDQPFYFTEDGTLKLIYQEYQIGPGYLGQPEIAIEKADYAPLLRTGGSSK